MPSTRSPGVSVLWVHTSQATYIDISIDTFRSCLFRPMSFIVSSGPFGAVMSVTNLKEYVTRCTWPCHLSHLLWMTVVIYLMPIFLRNGAEGVSSWHLAPQIPRVRWSLQRRRPCSEVFGPTFRYTRAYSSGHRPCTRRHAPLETGAWRWGQAIVSLTFPMPCNIWRQ